MPSRRPNLAFRRIACFAAVLGLASPVVGAAPDNPHDGVASAHVIDMYVGVLHRPFAPTALLAAIEAMTTEAC